MPLPGKLLSILIEQLQATAGGASHLAAYCAAADDLEAAASSAGTSSGAADAPADARPQLHGVRCVCDGVLERTPGRARSRTVLTSQYPTLEARQLDILVDAVIAEGASTTVCDLCDAKLQPTAPVWTCGNGEKTILHPTTYDVCVGCFARYAIDARGDEELPTERRN